MRRSPLDPTPMLRQSVAAALLVALALPAVGAIVAHGGFFPRGQIAFAVISCAAVLAVVAVAGWSGAALRTPAVWALAGLALVSALSALWTIGSAGAALRWAAVIAALALLAVAAAIVSARLGSFPIAAVIATLAFGAGLVGLYGAGARVEPLAQRLGGQWSPGGPLEYSPALALMQVSALPVMWAAMARSRHARITALAAMGAAVTGSIVALAGSRVELAIALAVVVACVVGAST